MGAHEGNRYAEKWTKEAALEFLSRARQEAGEDCYFLSEVTERCGEYPELLSYLSKKFHRETEVFQAIKKLRAKCESVLTRKTAQGEIPQALGIFLLKSCYGHAETSKVEHQGAALGEPIRLIVGERGERMVDELLGES